ncbi:sigma-70 family RNA polymerase sigma factor [Chitinophaga sp. G-6-1-13]|uniref:Sigma-70 family RNA polymerase sigma factor n=1 Tax=Chitinophaga fulva TaxID=2728842 RepID=A0A848GU53_9BACT|nr:sigma-70 family RNA polymerase sigma factor [Chitinophaga fulva]NML41011.1 sigma-70 family RNA polymerase sigma factor [Chitinophaga fulva]
MLDNSIYNDSELLSLVASGDQRAFTKIVAHYTPIIYKQLLIYIKSAPQAEEFTQDIFISIWRNREKLHDMSNFAGYLYVITRNKIHMAFREKLRVREAPLEDTLQTLLNGPESALELQELSRGLDRAIAMLPARRQEVFKLSRMENMTYEEIACQLQISKSAVRQHIIEALVFLRYYLREEMGVIVSVAISMILTRSIFFL